MVMNIEFIHDIVIVVLDGGHGDDMSCSQETVGEADPLLPSCSPIPILSWTADLTWCNELREVAEAKVAGHHCSVVLRCVGLVDLELVIRWDAKVEWG